MKTMVKVRFTGLYDIEVEGDTLNARRVQAEQKLRTQLLVPECSSTLIVPDDDLLRWDSYCDEHILYLRAVDDLCSVVEYIKVVPDDSDQDQFVLHGTLFLDDYLAQKETLDRVLNGFGYDSYAGFLEEDGHDLMLLAMFIAESLDEDSQFVMSKAEAAEFVRRLTNKEVYL